MFQLLSPSLCRLVSREGIVALGVHLSHCVCARLSVSAEP